MDLRPHRRLPFEQRQDLGYRLAERYRQGLSMAAIATELGTSQGRVRSLLLEQGVRLRKPGGQQDRPRADRQELAAVMAEQYAQGASLVVLAQRHDRSTSTVRRLVLTGGGQLRSRGGRPQGDRCKQTTGQVRNDIMTTKDRRSSSTCVS